MQQSVRSDHSGDLVRQALEISSDLEEQLDHLLDCEASWKAVGFVCSSQLALVSQDLKKIELEKQLAHLLRLCSQSCGPLTLYKESVSSLSEARERALESLFGAADKVSPEATQSLTLVGGGGSFYDQPQVKKELASVQLFMNCWRRGTG